jgi:aminoglycoside phosphotransferase (APT) family kinase protein
MSATALSTMFPDRNEPFIAWLAEQMPDVRGLKLDHARQLTFGHSNQTWDIGVSWAGGGDRYILRSPPDGIGLLEPYDVAKQYHVMKALAGGPVPLPKMLWLENSGSVLGKPFFLMERLDGFGIEWNLPSDLLEATPEAVRTICEQYIDAVAEVHLVDWRTVDTRLPPPAADPVAAEIDWWEARIVEHCGESLPSFEAVIAWLRANKPPPAEPRLVHGDPKLGNLLLCGSRLIALLDWEMSSIGDPLCDLGWLSFQWNGAFTAGFADLPGAMSWDEMAERYTARTGIATGNIRYYQVLQGYKAAAICFVGYMMFLHGTIGDPRFEQFGPVVPPQLDRMLALAGIASVSHGPVLDPLTSPISPP